MARFRLAFDYPDTLNDDQRTHAIVMAMQASAQAVVGKAEQGITRVAVPSKKEDGSLIEVDAIAKFDIKAPKRLDWAEWRKIPVTKPSTTDADMGAPQ